MYDEIVRVVGLNSDEIDILNELLLSRLETCVSVVEEIIVKNLLEKLD